MSAKHKKPGAGQSRQLLSRSLTSTTLQHPTLSACDNHKQPLAHDNCRSDSVTSSAVASVASPVVVLDGPGPILCGTCTAAVDDEAIGCDKCDGWFYPQSMCRLGSGQPNRPLLRDDSSPDPDHFESFKQ
ncbi:hypothetical protein E2C01_074242 [Portunus trituberculatus]|uniref:Uncharacterized protein n=1 Tax=Portunus trituberculatus TaxID=210409 RepID=A0A5B7I2W3_PORTR|nr:hypothetical protein [Portunus trituberculatus]